MLTSTADSRVQREVTALVEAGREVVVTCERDVGEPRLERRESLTIHRLPLRHVAGAGAQRLLAEYAAFLARAAVLVTPWRLRRRFAVVQVNSVLTRWSSSRPCRA